MLVGRCIQLLFRHFFTGTMEFNVMALHQLTADRLITIVWNGCSIQMTKMRFGCKYGLSMSTFLLCCLVLSLLFFRLLFSTNRNAISGTGAFASALLQHQSIQNENKLQTNSVFYLYWYLYWKFEMVTTTGDSRAPLELATSRNVNEQSQ